MLTVLLCCSTGTLAPSSGEGTFEFNQHLAPSGLRVPLVLKAKTGRATSCPTKSFKGSCSAQLCYFYHGSPIVQDVKANKYLFL